MEVQLLQIFTGNFNKAGIFGRTNNPSRSSAGLRMAPMIDMIFLLLIFFLVAAKWRPKEDFLPLALTAANAGTHTVGKTEPLIIQILATETGCRVQIGSISTVDIPFDAPEQNLALMMEKIAQCLLEQNRYVRDPVEIICAAEVKWEQLAKIYNVLYGMGLTDITFRMTEPPADVSR